MEKEKFERNCPQCNENARQNSVPPINKKTFSPPSIKI